MKIAFYNDIQLAYSENEYDLGVPAIWVDAPDNFNVESKYKLENGVVREMELKEYNPKSLRVHRALPRNLDPLINDFTILGFRKISPYYSRGMKKHSLYLCASSDDVVVEKIFEDVFSDDGRLTGLQVTFNFYNENNEIGLTKTEIVKSLNFAEARTEQRKRRARQVDFLEAGAQGTPIEPYVFALIDHYNDSIQKYITHNSNDWEYQINNETDSTILAYLSIQVPRLDDPTRTITIKESLLYQITGVLDE